tara:strand:- start:3818 stop:4450 length:633 start_codon:yes stop_codon:yes gene_type:complete
MEKHYFLTADGVTGWRVAPDDFPEGAEPVSHLIHQDVVEAMAAGRSVRVVDGEIDYDFERYFVSIDGTPGRTTELDGIPPGALVVSESAHAAARDAIAGGKTIKVIDGVLHIDWQEPEADPDPLTLTLSKRQINAALILAGHTDPDAFIEAAIGTIEDATARALALNDWRHAPHYEREHPLFNNPAMLAATEMSTQEIDDLWTLATQQPF